MKNKGKIIGIVVLLAVVLVGAGIGYRCLSEQYGKTEGSSIAKIEQDTSGNQNTAAENSDIQNSKESDASGEDADIQNSDESDTSEEDSDIENDEESDTSEEEPESQKIMAPDFSMTDENGEKVSLSDYFGKPVMLNFWATWCGPCKMEMPHFDKAYQEYQDRMNFLIVDLTDGSRDTVESASAFVEEEGYSFPIFFDTESEGAYTYGIDSIPTTFFINSDGTLEAYQIGALTEELLMGQLEKMAGQEVSAE